MTVRIGGHGQFSPGGTADGATLLLALEQNAIARQREFTTAPSCPVRRPKPGQTDDRPGSSSSPDNGGRLIPVQARMFNAYPGTARIARATTLAAASCCASGKVMKAFFDWSLSPPSRILLNDERNVTQVTVLSAASCHHDLGYQIAERGHTNAE